MNQPPLRWCTNPGSRLIKKLEITIEINMLNVVEEISKEDIEFPVFLKELHDILKKQNVIYKINKVLYDASISDSDPINNR